MGSCLGRSIYCTERSWQLALLEPFLTADDILPSFLPRRMGQLITEKSSLPQIGPQDYE